MNSLEEEKENELLEVQEELRSAQEEVLMLQQAAEEVAAERENDIACLQEELCRLRAELQRLHAAAKESEVEIAALRAEIGARSPDGHAHTPGRMGSSLHVLTTAFFFWRCHKSGAALTCQSRYSAPLLHQPISALKQTDDKMNRPPDWLKPLPRSHALVSGAVSQLTAEIASLTDQQRLLSSDNRQLSTEVERRQRQPDM